MVTRIEQYVDGKPIKKAELMRDGTYHCYPAGQTLNIHRVRFPTLEEVAHYLTRVDIRARVRMTPGRAMIADHIYIDGVPREELAKR